MSRQVHSRERNPVRRIRPSPRKVREEFNRHERRRGVLFGLETTVSFWLPSVRASGRDVRTSISVQKRAEPLSNTASQVGTSGFGEVHAVVGDCIERAISDLRPEIVDDESPLYSDVDKGAVVPLNVGVLRME